MTKIWNKTGTLRHATLCPHEEYSRRSAGRQESPGTELGLVDVVAAALRRIQDLFHAGRPLSATDDLKERFEAEWQPLPRGEPADHAARR